MSGTRISLVRKSIRRLVRSLAEKDRLCFVAFDSNVKVLMEFTCMDESGRINFTKTLDRNEFINFFFFYLQYSINFVLSKFSITPDF